MADRFFLWKKRVDSIVYDKISLHLDDLVDEAYRDNYEKGVSAKEMAKKIIYEYENMI